MDYNFATTFGDAYCDTEARDGYQNVSTSATTTNINMSQIYTMNNS